MKGGMRRNILSTVIYQAGTYLVPMLNYPFLTRTLDVHAYGVFGFAFALATYPVLVANWGFDAIAPGEIARLRDDKRAMSAYVWSVLTAKAMLGALALVVVIAAALLLPALKPIATPLIVANLLVLANIITVNWLLQGLERFELFATAATVGRFLTVPATYLLVSGPQDVWIAVAVQVGGAIIVGIFSLLLIWRLRVIDLPGVHPTAVWSQIKSGTHVFIATASSNLYTTLNTVIISVLLGPLATGYFVAADRLRFAAQGVIQPISLAARPRSFRLIAESRSAGFDFVRKVLFAQVSVAAFTALVTIVFAPLIIRIMAGPSFTESVNVLRFLGCIPLLVSISDTMGLHVMLPLGMKGRFAAIRSIAALINLVLVTGLTLSGGIVGAAMGTVVTEIFILWATVRAARGAGFRFTRTPVPEMT